MKVSVESNLVFLICLRNAITLRVIHIIELVVSSEWNFWSFGERRRYMSGGEATISLILDRIGVPGFRIF